MGSESRLDRALTRIDEVNTGDPREEWIEGRREPKELVYSRRMSERLERFSPKASEALRIAVRAQHIARWKVPRESYPEGREGYRAWRTRLMDLHAGTAADILRDVGYDEATVERVGSLLRKRAIKRDPDAQTLEDVACLVFLEHYFADFAAKHDDEKLVTILRKTLLKMSPEGREAALGIELGPRGQELVARALGS